MGVGAEVRESKERRNEGGREGGRVGRREEAMRTEG